jgi:hypothetical protein
MALGRIHQLPITSGKRLQAFVRLSLIGAVLVWSTAPEDSSAAGPNKAKTTLVKTGVIAQRMFVDPEARYACVFGQLALDDNQAHTRAAGAPTRLAVVDLRKRKVVAACETVGDIRHALVDGQQVLWAPTNIDKLYRLKFAKGSKREEKLLEKTAVEMHGLGPQQIVLVEIEPGDKGAELAVYDRESLAEVGDHPLSRRTFKENRSPHPSLIQLGDSMIYVDGRVIDAQTGETRCYVEEHFGPMRIAGPDGEISWGLNNYHGHIYWRRTLDPGSQEVKQWFGEGSFQVTGSLAHISTTDPLVASLTSGPSDFSNMTRLSVELQDLVHGQVVRRIELSEPVQADYGQLPFDAQLRFVSNWLVVSLWDELLVCEMPKKYLQDDVLEPLRLLFPQMAVADVTKPAEFQFQTRGGKPPYRYGFVEPLAGSTLDENTGVIKLNLPEMWKKFLVRVAEGRRSSGDTLNQPFVEDRYGVETLEGMGLVSLPVQLKVRDQSGQSDRIVVTVVAYAPRAEFKAAEAKHQQGSRAERGSNFLKSIFAPEER